jgi:hypothetical protein
MRLRSIPSHQTALAMVGAKAGQAVVFLGTADVELAAEVGRTTGLNGRTVVVADGATARVEVERAAANAGALVEFVQAPVVRAAAEPAGAFDLAVIAMAGWALAGRDARRDVVTRAFGLVRPGGRIVAVLSSGRRRRFGAAPLVDRAVVDETLALLTEAGSRAVRTLADMPGTTYAEGVRPRAT